MTALAKRRGDARTAFNGRGLPTRRVEEWKYSDLKSTLGDDGLGEAQAIARALTPAGVEQVDLSAANLPAWVSEHLGTLAKNAVSDASLAFATGGIALRVLTGKVIDVPLALDLVQAGHVRVLLVIEDGASLTILESGDVAGPRNVGIEIVLGEGATLEHVRIAAATPAVQVEEIALSLAAKAQYRAHFANFGAKLSRTELTIVLEGEGAQAHLSGVSVLADGKHADVTTTMIHRKPNTHSTQLFKKVAAGKSRAVYQGRVVVAKGADGVDSAQTAKALLLGDLAEADLKPELEIFADDVKCAHGAAIGDLDADSLFYLRARGIPEAEARGLLLHAFLEDAMGEIRRDDLRDQVRATVETVLQGIA
jgi:Fe-S cluster assembly protein SufD